MKASAFRDPSGLSIHSHDFGEATLNESPAVICNVFDLALWEARFDGYTNAAAVTTMTDRSPAASNWTQGTAANQPKSYLLGPNGLPFVRFDGSNDVVQRAANITDTTLTLIMVARRPTAGGSYQTWWNTQKYLCYGRLGTDVWGMYQGTDISSGEAASTSWKVYTFNIRTEDEFDMGSNGAMVNYASAYTAYADSETLLGASSTGASEPAYLDIAALAIASTNLSASKIAAANAYFRNVYLI